MSTQKTAEKYDIAILMDENKEDLLPLVHDTGKSFDRLIATMRTAAEENDDLYKCTPQSVLKEIRKCAADGLVPDNKEAAILPYWNKDKRCHEAQYQPMVLGIIKRLRELGDVFSIVCEVVREKDDFYVDMADLGSLKHKSSPFDSQRGEIVGAYVIFRDKESRVLHREIMSLEDLETVRSVSKAPNSPAWRNWRAEMFRKAVLRRGAKYITINNDKVRQLIERTDAMYDFEAQNQNRALPLQRGDPFGTGAMIEHTKDDPDYKPGESEVDLRKPEPETQKRADPEPRKQEPEEKKPEHPEPEKEPAKTVNPWELKVTEPDHIELMVEISRKAIALVYEDTIDILDRKQAITKNVPGWKEHWPMELHDVLSWIVKFCDDALKRMGRDEDHEVALKANLDKLSKQLGVEISIPPSKEAA